MKSVIRVQDAEGRGMFYATEINGTENTSVYYIEELYELCKRHSKFPNAREDSPILSVLAKIDYVNMDNEAQAKLDKAKWRFSFKNLEQFEKWVTRDEIKTLTYYGYRVVRVFATNVVIGVAQNLFNIDSVTRTEDITDLFL